MADNITLNTNVTSGDVVATEDISGVEYQKVKLVDGTATSTTAIPLSGDLANGLDVDVTRVSGTVTVDGSGVTQPVSGTVTANPASGTIDTVTTVTSITNDVNIADGGNSITIDGTAPPNLVSTNNSTTTPLGVSGVYTGTADDVSAYSSVTIHLYADVASATDGMTFEFCDENTFAQPDSYAFTMAAGANRRFQFPVTAQYFRVKYTNGGTGQTTFIVQTILHGNNVSTSVHRLVDNISPDRSAEVVKSAVFAQTSGAGDFVAIAANASGKLQVAAEAAGSETVADNDATPTDAIHSQSFNMVYDGANWDMARGDATNGLLVDLGTNNDVTVSSGSLTLAANSGVDIGDVDVTSISAGSNLIGDVGLSGARTSGGTTLYKNIDVDESEDEIKGTAGQVYWIHAINLTASPLYLKLYNATAATVVVGTTVPDLTFPIPTQGDTNGAGFTLSVPNGIAFSTAISIAATTGLADNDAGAPAANAVIVNLGYA